ncbi:YppG family protein [Mesobacillus zeae]|nr:YppG family protein [Mesobacillus zeae]
MNRQMDTTWGFTNPAQPLRQLGYYHPAYQNAYWGGPLPGPTGQFPLPAQYPYQQPQMGQGWNENIQDQDYSKMLFENPLQQGEISPYGQYQQHAPMQPMNPYPAQHFAPKQPTGMQSIMNSFKSQDGSLDINKMVDTAGQMMSAVTQVSSMVKGLGGMLKA